MKTGNIEAAIAHSGHIHACQMSETKDEYNAAMEAACRLMAIHHRAGASLRGWADQWASNIGKNRSPGWSK